MADYTDRTQLGVIRSWSWVVDRFQFFAMCLTDAPFLGEALVQLMIFAEMNIVRRACLYLYEGGAAHPRHERMWSCVCARSCVQLNMAAPFTAVHPEQRSCNRGGPLFPDLVQG